MSHAPCKGCGKPYKSWPSKRRYYIEYHGRRQEKKYRYVKSTGEYCSKACRRKYYSDNSIREQFSSGLREYIYRRDGRRCKYCGEKQGDTYRFSIDHILPVTRGGTNDLDNLVACCQTCNSIASNRVFESFTEKQDWILNRQKLQKPKDDVPDWRAWVYGGMKSLRNGRKT